MNKKLPFVPNETDAILYVIISVLLLISVNQVLSQPQILGDLNPMEDTYNRTESKAGNYLVFSADQYQAGYEPHSLNLNEIAITPCDEIVAANTFGEAELSDIRESFIRQAPNPFMNEFSLMINVNENETAQVEIYTMTGSAAESLRDLSSNVEYRLGIPGEPECIS